MTFDRIPPVPPPKRDSRSKRGYTREHYKQRKLVFIEQDGLCAICHNAFAQDLDHIDGNTNNKHRSNVQGLCRACHNRKTKGQ